MSISLLRTKYAAIFALHLISKTKSSQTLLTLLWETTVLKPISHLQPRHKRLPLKSDSALSCTRNLTRGSTQPPGLSCLRKLVLIPHWKKWKMWIWQIQLMGPYSTTVACLVCFIRQTACKEPISVSLRKVCESRPYLKVLHKGWCHSQWRLLRGIQECLCRPTWLWTSWICLISWIQHPHLSKLTHQPLSWYERSVRVRKDSKSWFKVEIKAFSWISLCKGLSMYSKRPKMATALRVKSLLRTCITWGRQ